MTVIIFTIGFRGDNSVGGWCFGRVIKISSDELEVCYHVNICAGAKWRIAREYHELFVKVSYILMAMGKPSLVTLIGAAYYVF